MLLEGLGIFAAPRRPILERNGGKRPGDDRRVRDRDRARKRGRHALYVLASANGEVEVSARGEAGGPSSASAS